MLIIIIRITWINIRSNIHTHTDNIKYRRTNERTVHTDTMYMYTINLKLLMTWLRNKIIVNLYVKRLGKWESENKKTNKSSFQWVFGAVSFYAGVLGGEFSGTAIMSGPASLFCRRKLVIIYIYIKIHFALKLLPVVYLEFRGGGGISTYWPESSVDDSLIL